MAILNNSNAISTAGGYDINNSLRFRASASAYLSRTPASAGTRTTWTWSGWVKRGALSSAGAVISCGSYSTNLFQVYFDSSDQLYINNFPNSTTPNVALYTTQVFRDPSAWYHIVVVMDTTQATSSNRVKIYINGSQVTAFSTATYPAQNATPNWNTGSLQHNLGARDASTLLFDGYMTEINFIDGQALTPSSFGETNTTTGVWKPKAYTGTYGTNGFYLKFSDIATTSGSNAGLGKDFSGNTNYWNTTNISVTAGTTYDAMIDSPTLTSATVANYPTLNPLIKQISGSVTEGNLKGAGSSYECWGTMAFPSTGKYYFEYTHNGSTGAGNGPAIGIVGLNKPDEDYGVKYNKNGTKWLNGTNSIAYGASYTTGDVIGVAYDADSNSITFYKNNTSQGATTTTSGYTYLPYHFDNSGSGGFLNFGQRPFTYTPPTGFVRLNTYNLPDSTIKAGNNSFGVLTYTGNGSTSVTRSDTSLVNFTPDFVWIKERSGTAYHNLFDINRVVSGDYKRIYSNDTTAEESSTYLGTTNLNSFVNGGFTTGSGTNTNNNGSTYVAWCWDANGSPVSNTSGSTTSTVSVNTTAGFSVVTYTGTGSAATIGHGLGVAPKWIVVKGRNTVIEWLVYHTSLGATQYITLNTTGAAASAASAWNNTAPTSSVFSVLSAGSTNFSGTNYVAYCWAEIAGFSAFGSYTGNGNADGPFVYLGFRPKYVMIKRTDATQNWPIIDTSRDTYNVANKRLFANLSDAEDAGITNFIDILSNGFKCRDSNISYNASGGTYIYMAFAENPFKNANAR
jgi:hypothetical protein